MTIQVGDIVRRGYDNHYGDPNDIGLVLDTYEDDYGIVYYEVHWGASDKGWWTETELVIIK